MTDKTKKYFPRNLSNRERAIFECGIALGTIYHAFTGIPVRMEIGEINMLEKVIENSILAQPYREFVKVKIRPPQEIGKRPFNYFVLKGKHIEATVVINYGGERVVGKMDYKKDLNYTLMYLSDEPT
jgi:hypothetical protein